MKVRVIGAGPAGSSAALSALRDGAEVVLFDKSSFPRHKVCGEFLSPEVAKLLDGMGVWGACERERPSTLRSVHLTIGDRTKQWKLPDAARGLSRHAMDRILMEAARERGALIRREQAKPVKFDVVANGRNSQAPKGERLFGFKAHFTGPEDDVMRLYFFGGAYVGVNAVEGGRTNVCGVAPERVLRENGFGIDEFLLQSRALGEHLAPMTREMEWLRTGPLVFGPAAGVKDCYMAGDAAAFIDPFTGSGMLGAVTMGMLAGRAAARGTETAEYAKKAASLMRGQQRAAGFLRSAIDSGWAEKCLPLIPGNLLFHATRPGRLK